MIVTPIEMKDEGDIDGNVSFDIKDAQWKKKEKKKRKNIVMTEIRNCYFLFLLSFFWSCASKLC